MAAAWCVKEFFPLAVKCVHLRGHDSVTVHFGIRSHPLTLLMLVRGTSLLVVYESGLVHHGFQGVITICPS